MLGDNADQRCSLFNGYDLTTKAGVQKLKRFVDEVRPVHIWISCDCGPYSPLQHLNQKTETQRENLRLKREYAQKEYKGAIELARYASPRGSQIHFELSERCEACPRFLRGTESAEGHLSRVHSRIKSQRYWGSLV